MVAARAGRLEGEAQRMEATARNRERVDALSDAQEATHVAVSALTKHFGETAAVDGLSFRVAKGEILALLGPSGCGKTTVLRCLAGLEAIDGGTIAIGSSTISQRGTTVPPARRDIGFVFQSYALWPHMTVRENVSYGLTVQKVAPSAKLRRCEEILELVGLQELANRMPSELSGGQQQRVALARSLVVEPGVLLLDEPLSNLDAALREHMRKEIRRILKQVGTTSIFVTHDQREAFAISDRVVLMRSGQAVQVDSPEDMYDNPRSRFAATFVGGANVVRIRSLKAQQGAYFSGDTEALGPLVAVLSRGASSTEVTTAVFRPEDVDVVAHGQRRNADSDAVDVNAWEATVEERTFEGSVTELVLSVQGHLIRAIGRANGIAVGDRVSVRVAHNRTVLVAD